MNRYVFLIPHDVSDVKLYALTRRMLPELPAYAIREAFDQRDVKMEGVRVGKDARAVPGAQVCLYTRHGGRAQEVPILYEDANVLIVRKPVGMSCEADAKGGKTVAEWVAEALRAKEPTADTPLLCHRLDNQTDGLMLLAKHPYAQEELIRAFQLHTIHKTYICLVKGEPTPRYAVLKAYLIKDAQAGRVRVVDLPMQGAKPIVTEYRVLATGEAARLEVKLHTGRTHQIRAQMAAVHHPILGDDVYGDRAFNKAKRAKRMMLCATGLSFSLKGPMAYLNERTFSIEPLF